MTRRLYGIEGATMAGGDEINVERLQAVRVLASSDAVVLHLTTAAGANHFYELTPEGLASLAKQLTADAVVLAAPAGKA